MPKLVHRERVPRKIAEAILKQLRTGAAIAACAEAAGIHRDTFYDWVKRGEEGEAGYKEFAEKVRIARAQAELKIFGIVRRSMGKASGPGAPMWQPAAWWLERRNAAEFGRKDKVSVAGPGGGPIPTIDVTKLSDEDLQKVADGTYMPPAQIAAPK